LSETKYLNLGCGNRSHPDWINIDIAPQGPGVIQNDLSRGIPLPDASCDVVYHAAVLEHLRRSDAEKLMNECHRVLKPGGILRVGVPDFEKICHLYLTRLTASLNGDTAAAHDYNWIMLEMFDQIAREESGGNMLDYLRQNPLPNELFIYERIGEEGRDLVNVLHNSSGHLQRKQRSIPSLLHKFLKALHILPKLAKNCVLFLFLGNEDRRALEIGQFRLAGEVHHWMYDRYSLARLFETTGFHNPQVFEAHSSIIPNWTLFHLDTLPDGRTIKPDLFFMEAIKQGRPYQ